MPWLFLLFSLGALAVAFTTTSIPLAAIALLFSLVCVVIGVMGLLAQRLGNQSRSEAMMVDPMELRRLREQADARRAAAADDAARSPPAGP
jgi:hypothetical protein